MLVQYYIVDHSLSMRRGKAAAQVAHAAEKALLAGQQEQNTVGWYDTPYTQWLEGDLRTKVVLKGTTADLQRALDEIPNTLEIRDAGLTEIEPNTRTVVVLPVMSKENAPSWVQQLSLL